jgi:hypothetical protein
MRNSTHSLTGCETSLNEALNQVLKLEVVKAIARLPEKSGGGRVEPS